jgi:hypothetical protein
MGSPADDLKTYGELVAKAVAAVVRANGTSEEPESYAKSVRGQILPQPDALHGRDGCSLRLCRVERRSMTDNAPDVIVHNRVECSHYLGIGKDSVTSKPCGLKKLWKQVENHQAIGDEGDRR